MFALRMLSGPQAGQIFMLKPGLNVLGRASSCDVKILSPSVSKEHMQIEVLGDKIILSDLRSRNGTFVNGVQVRSTRIKPGDRIGVNDVLFDVIPAATLSKMMANQGHRGNAYPVSSSGGGGYGPGGTAQALYPEAQAHPTTDELVKKEGLSAFWKIAQQYIETVMLPGVYKLPEYLEFKWVLGLLMALFIVLVTSLSTVPLIRILKASIEGESQQHALTIASTLARLNRQALMQGVESALTVESAMRRPGVKRALIISNVDGNVLAPANQAGSFPDIAFVHEARQNTKESVKQVDGDTIVAVVPIEFYNAETGTYTVQAHAVVVYDMGALAVDGGKTLSLFVQTLFIALLLGSLLFFFLYKLIEHPIHSLNEQIDSALKDGGDQIRIRYLFPPLQKLASNIGSALARVGQGSGMGAGVEHDRRFEMGNIVELIGYGAMAIQAADRSIIAMNASFSERSGLKAESVVNSPLSTINDQALKLSLQDLIARLEVAPDQLATNELEFGGLSFQIAGQAVYGTQSIAYFLFVLVPLEGGG